MPTALSAESENENANDNEDESENESESESEIESERLGLRMLSPSELVVKPIILAAQTIL